MYDNYSIWLSIYILDVVHSNLVTSRFSSFSVLELSAILNIMFMSCFITGKSGMMTQSYSLLKK